MNPVVLNPELTFVAIGALAGVVLTVFVNLLTGMVQRRADRILKTYETRLEIFTEFWFTVQEFSEMSAWIRKLEQDEDLRQFLQWKDILIAAQDDAQRIETELIADPPLAPDRARDLRNEARAKADKLSEAMAAIERAEPRAERTN